MEILAVQANIVAACTAVNGVTASVTVQWKEVKAISAKVGVGT